MAKPEWGIKRVCPSCNARFYDMKKKTLACPKCGTVIDLTPKKKARPAAEPKKMVPKPVVHKDDDLDRNDNMLMEDTSDLSNDDDMLGIDLQDLEDADEI